MLMLGFSYIILVVEWHSGINLGSEGPHLSWHQRCLWKSDDKLGLNFPQIKYGRQVGEKYCNPRILYTAQNYSPASQKDARIREDITFPNWQNTLERILFKLKKKNGEKILKWRKTEPSKWVSMRKREIMENMDESEWIYLRPSEKMLLTLWCLCNIYCIYDIKSHIIVNANII